MPKFFIDKNTINNNSVSISGTDASHLVKVLRISEGEKLTLCDGEGGDYSSVVTSVLKDCVSLKITDSYPCEAEPSVSVTLFQGLPKQGKMDYIIEKCTELGISRIVPVSLKRSVAVVRDDKAEDKKLLRWRKIASESVKQCGRGIVPEVTGVMNLKEAIALAKTFDLNVAAYENERETPLKSVLEGKNPKSVGIFIGPEGGFDPGEIEEFLKNEIPSVTLGKRILRTETAGCAVLTAVMYEFNEMS